MDFSPKDILQFWFSDAVAKHWFASTAELDEEIRQRFEPAWMTASTGEYMHWTETAEGSLALCILLDQFPLNMFRGQSKSFNTEQHAVAISKQAITNGQHQQLDDRQVSFLYMPLMHSEQLEDQQQCVELFEQRKLPENLRFARHHRDLIQRFGRFPHRNAILGRESTPEEIAYLQSKEAFKG